MIENIFLIVFIMIPLYALFIWSFFYPEESILFGKRWMYNEEPEVSEVAILFTKIASIIAVIFLTLILVKGLFFS